MNIIETIIKTKYNKIDKIILYNKSLLLKWTRPLSQEVKRVIIGKKQEVKRVIIGIKTRA